MHEDPEAPRVPERFESFYEREYAKVVGLAYALSGSRSISEDLAQESFLAAHRAWDRVAFYDRPEAWVRRVVANLAVSFVRKRVLEAKTLARLALHREPSLPDLSPEDADFWAAVRRLPRRQGQVVALHYLEDRSVVDVAEILGLAEGTVKAHLHGARAALARRLGLEREGGR